MRPKFWDTNEPPTPLPQSEHGRCENCAGPSMRRVIFSKHASGGRRVEARSEEAKAGLGKKNRVGFRELTTLFYTEDHK